MICFFNCFTFLSARKCPEVVRSSFCFKAFGYCQHVTKEQLNAKNIEEKFYCTNLNEDNFRNSLASNKADLRIIGLVFTE